MKCPELLWSLYRAVLLHCVIDLKDHAAFFHSECLSREPLSQGDGLRYFPRSPTGSCASSLLFLWRLTRVLHGGASLTTSRRSPGWKPRGALSEQILREFLLCFTSHSELLVDFCFAMRHILFQTEQTCEMTSSAPLLKVRLRWFIQGHKTLHSCVKQIFIETVWSAVFVFVAEQD